VITDHGLRYFTVREMARVQTFPDDYQFDPVWSHAIKEIGNACPPTLAKQWLESLLEGPTAETTTVPEDPPLSPGVAETAHDEAMDSLRRELGRRVKLTHILEAHASVLQGLLDNATKTLLTQPGCIDTYILSLHERATDLESHLIPDDHDVRAAIEHSDLSPLKPEVRLQVGKAVDRTLELSSLLRTLRQERALATAMAEGRTTTDTLAHLPAYENSRMTEARRAAYQHDVDSSLDATRDGHLQIPRKDLKKAVFFKCPTRLLRESPTVEDEACPLFNVNWQDTLDSEAEEDTTKYYSVRADLLIDDGTGARISLSSVVDSGAAWTALKHGFLARTAPELLKLMSPSKRRFKDAQGPSSIPRKAPVSSSSTAASVANSPSTSARDSVAKMRFAGHVIARSVGLMTTKGVLTLVGLCTVSSRDESPSWVRTALVRNRVGVRRSGSRPMILGSRTARLPGSTVIALSSLSLAGLNSERVVGSSILPSGEVTCRTLLSASYVIEARWLGVSSGEHSVHVSIWEGEGQLSQVSQRAVRMGTPLDGVPAT